MVKKDKILIKRLMIEGGIAALAIAVSVGAMIFVGGLESASEDALRKQTNEVNATRGKISSIKQQLEESGRSVETYEKISALKNTTSFEINRKEAKKYLSDLRKKYRLSSLGMTVAPEKPFEDPNLKSLEVGAAQTSIALTFGGMSDTHLLSFIQDLQASMPGFVKIEKLSLKRDKAMDVSIYRQMSRGGTPELVSGEMTFNWIGFTKEDAEETEGGQNG